MENGIVILKQSWILNKWSVLIAFFLAFSVYGQEDDLYDHGLNQDKWEDIREGIRYEGVEDGPGRQWTYENDQEYQEERRRYGDGGGSGGGEGNDNGGGSDGQPQRYYKPPPPSNADVSTPAVGGLGVLGYILLGVFVVGLLVLIFYLFLNSESKGAAVKQRVTTDNIEDVNPTEIPLTELQRLLKEALDSGDYRGAVRIYFIFIVRGLSEKGWIQWEKEKTNFHYLSEMAGKKGYDDFILSVTYFEFIWYGKREIDAAKFEEIQPNFTGFLDKLGVK